MPRRFAVLCVLQLLLSTEAFAQTGCIVADPTGTPLNVRELPAGRSVTGVLYNGTNVAIYQTSRDPRGKLWALVGKPGGDTYGWVFREYINCERELQSVLNFPRLTGRVVDQAEILDGRSRKVIEQKLAALEELNTDQLFVVTLESLQGSSIEGYATKLFNYWGIGRKDKNNGVLLLVAPNDQKVRIEVGYGLEGTLTDATASKIIGSMLPQLRDNDFPSGITYGVDAIIEVLSQSNPAATYASPLPQIEHRSPCNIGAHAD